jgi:MFS family permease
LTKTSIAGTDAADRRATRSLLLLVCAVFFTFMTIGLPLPVIPLYVGHELALGNVLVGLSVGIQFLATILTRGYAGQTADRDGAKGIMLRGMFFCACSGLASIISAKAPVPDIYRLLILIAGRLVLGFGESQVVVGMLGWGIATAGQARSSTVLAWTGMAMYGSIAVAAPIGYFLYQMGGLTFVGIATLLLPGIAGLLAFRVAHVPPAQGDRQSFWKVIGLIWQPGLGALFQGVGFAAIGAFISLDFAAKHWSGTGIGMTCFGGAFVLVRIFCGRMPNRFGGNRVAIVSLLVEVTGQLLLFLAPSSGVALLGAAATGAGCSMVFPALGVEIVKRVPANIRSTALGGFAAFQDAAYGLTGPVTGVFATAFGYPSVFAVGAACGLSGVFITVAMLRGALGWRATA